MAKPVVSSRNRGRLVLTVPGVNIADPPYLPRQTILEVPPQGPDPGIDLPVIVTPRNGESNDPASAFFDTSADQRSVSFFDLFFAAVLTQHTYFDTVSPTFNSFVGDNLGITPAGRIVVDAPSKRRIDTYRTADGKEIWCIPGASSYRDWLDFATPGMTTLAGGGGTIKAYTGLAVLCGLYVNYALSNLTAKADAGKGAITIVGHSAGGVVAQYLAFILNYLYKVSHPTGTDYPVGRVMSFGSPAAFNVGDSIADFQAGYGHYRAFTPSDPVPYSTILATKLATFTGSPFGGEDDGYAGPLIYSRSYIPISENWGAKEEESDLAFLHALDGRRYVRFQEARRRAVQVITRLKQGDYDAVAHGIVAYCNQLESACRAKGQAPYPLFSQLVMLSRAAPWLLLAS